MRRELDYEGEAALGSLDPVSRPALAIGPEGMAGIAKSKESLAAAAAQIHYRC